MMVTAAKCKAYAADCRRLAECCVRDLKIPLSDLAREWDVIADQMARQERRETGIENVLEGR